MTPPLAWSPWQEEHFSAKILAPSAGVPWPGGRPAPFGRIAMSHCWRSASESGRPRLGDSASAAPAPARARRRTAIGLRVDMLDLPFAVDAPARDAVVVLVGKGERRRDRLLGLAAGRHELGAKRVNDFGCTGSCSAASPQLLPPSADTSTFAMRPVPE